MLEMPLETIAPDNHDYKQVVANMLFENEKESAFDPRL